MDTEILSDNCYFSVPSNFNRPFRLHVQDRTFVIDAECMRKISPVFSAMCYGKDFEGGRELSREIVDEKCDDIDVFLRNIYAQRKSVSRFMFLTTEEKTVGKVLIKRVTKEEEKKERGRTKRKTALSQEISASNFALILRLSRKYQVLPIIEACQDFIRRTDLRSYRPNDVLTLLMAAYDFQCDRDVLMLLIHRLAIEGNAVFARLKISRFLPVEIYSAVISTSINITELNEYENMNGHCLRMERSKIRWSKSVCEQCKAISDQCATCGECKKNLCIQHVQELPCTTDYGRTLVDELKKNVIVLELDE
ncbi:hypothetical protein DICVIV_13747 [Dictyocaulus viviparus]|uniref:BTB domain-containing protein n=1 Tax=Dictyocaulus viviparus TaxID=29172 RepID=A0A0D8X727_DICVI|nr:hypothetical protein DICVIV_13747 [Dictyocaulus viviparus]